MRGAEILVNPLEVAVGQVEQVILELVQQVVQHPVGEVVFAITGRLILTPVLF